MSDSKIRVKDLKRAIISLFENQNPLREVHFSSDTGVEAVENNQSGPINREEFNHHLQEFYETEHHVIKLQEEDLVKRVQQLEDQIQRQNRTIARLLGQILSLEGRIVDLENFSGLTEFQNEININTLQEEETQQESVISRDTP